MLVRKTVGFGHSHLDVLVPGLGLEKAMNGEPPSFVLAFAEIPRVP